MIGPEPLPHGQAAWHAFAVELNARLARLQVHWEPNWLYALCTSCGWDLELDRSELARFRFLVPNHDCELAFDAVPSSEPLSPELEEMLF